MRRVALLLPLLLCVFGLNLRAEEGPGDKLIMDEIKSIEEMSAILATIKDKATFETALPKLKAVYKSLTEVGQALEKVMTDNPEGAKALVAKYHDKGVAAEAKAKAEFDRIDKIDPELKKSIDEAMK